MGNTPLGYLWGWSAPIQVTLCPIDSCYSLNWGIRHLERSFHLSSTQGGLSTPREDYHLASHYPGGLSLPREDYHLSPCRFRTVTPICREKWPAVHIWSTSSLTPFPHNNSGLVYLLLSKGLWVKSIKFKICTICERFRPKKLSSSIDIYMSTSRKIVVKI